MKRKQKVALLFSTVLMLMFLVACGNDSNNENNTANDNNNTSNNEGEILSLGESGVVKGVLGEFEVTIDSFEIHETYDGEDTGYEDLMFVLVNFTVKNVGETVLNGEDIARPTLLSEDEHRATNDFSVKVNRLDEEIQPGEESSGQMIFRSPDSDIYRLAFGYNMATIDNEVTWEFSKSESK